MRKFAFMLTIMAVLMGGLFCGEAQAVGKYKSPAEMMDKEWFTRHNSDITGEMVQQIVWREQRVPPHVFLTVIAAETSMGDPKLGGRLVGYHNYGCLKAAKDTKTPWAILSNGTVQVGKHTWMTFPDAETGVRALAIYLREGPKSNPGYYLKCFRLVSWYRSFASVYYGQTVPGFDAYVQSITRLDATFKRVAVLNGWKW